MKFIDLFAGLGGFHVALEKLNHKCVFASELSQPLRDLYEKNHGIKPKGDIRKIVKEKISSIPKHDILCAGFPCQPFSKAGNQAGREDEDRGTLFDEIYKILKFREPKYFILENVPYIAKHDNEETWDYMLRKLRSLKYEVEARIYSPHHFGIPQHRERIFIVGSKKGLAGLDHFSWPEPDFEGETDIATVLDPPNKSTRYVHEDELGCLRLWQTFLNAIPAKEKIPGFPIWAMEFGATYPFEKGSPYTMSKEELGKYRGNFGVSLKGLTKKEQMLLLPSYARTKKKFPDWKREYIRKNREFYDKHRDILQNFVQKLSRYESQSWQKLEWNVQDGERDIFNYILQFRASGIRVKNTNFFPSLVCTNTQTPIIGWERRYISKKEGARLQSLDSLSYLPDNDNAAMKALGNAVNSKVVELIAERLIKVKRARKAKAQRKVILKVA